MGFNYLSRTFRSNRTFQPNSIKPFFIHKSRDMLVICPYKLGTMAMNHMLQVGKCKRATTPAERTENSTCKHMSSLLKKSTSDPQHTIPTVSQLGNPNCHVDHRDTTSLHTIFSDIRHAFKPRTIHVLHCTCKIHTVILKTTLKPCFLLSPTKIPVPKGTRR